MSEARASGSEPGGPEASKPSVQTLDRGLRLLELIALSHVPLSLAELSQQMRLHRSIVYRLLRTLQDHRLIAHTPQGYMLGTRAQSLGRRTLPVLQRIAKPEIAKLAARVGLTAFFVVRDGEEAVTLVSVEVESSRSRAVYTPGDRHPLTLGSPGIAMLAAEPPRDDERPEITLARAAGYATTRSEVVPGLATLSASVVSAPGNAVAAVSIVFTVERPGPAEIEAVLDTARVITGRLRTALSTGAVLPGIG
ncbi:IclR family transcriptional regulator [Streptomyces acidiscabies]|uniref:IclR family transcriptional regulator n=1 Tax=Streptomyces acidiscabies TaxID=42234 RepID=UPI00073E28D1|nr:helix-turn-helix domain-containing protein [Streptomyces acidiscabies]GAQ55280.1 HTH-type transcriptional repressor AllR [Streptomyces acidiscabies]GAV40545.1 HTH-type transcriptional repressor AllR [Streptomyces acidiscabies]